MAIFGKRRVERAAEAQRAEANQKLLEDARLAYNARFHTWLDDLARA